VIPRAKIALVHVAKHQVGMTDDEYRALLAEFGVSSSKELRSAQLSGVMQRFKALGFVPRRRFKTPPESKKLLTAKVEKLVSVLDLTHGYVDAMARHMFGVDAWRWLDAHQLHKLVAALEIHKRRRGIG